MEPVSKFLSQNNLGQNHNKEKSMMMSPAYFVKQVLHYKGDLYRMYYGLHKNYTISQIVKLHKQIKAQCPKLPNLILKNEGFETLPEEYKSQISKLISNDEPIGVPSFRERFELNRQKTRYLNRAKIVTNNRKLVPYEGKIYHSPISNIEIQHIIIGMKVWVNLKSLLINEDGSYIEEISFVEPYHNQNECHIWLNMPEGEDILRVFDEENIEYQTIED